MSYGYGLGVYWSDYNDPEESECSGCGNEIFSCECPPIETEFIECEQCGKSYEVVKGSIREICYQCVKTSAVDLDFEPPY